jgi:hypothetical protein
MSFSTVVFLILKIFGLAFDKVFYCLKVKLLKLGAVSYMHHCFQHLATDKMLLLTFWCWNSIPSRSAEDRI